MFLLDTDLSEIFIQNIYFLTLDLVSNMYFYMKD